VHDGFLLDDNRRSNFRCVEKCLRHFFGDANTTVRCRVRRDVALMHRVTAAEEHRIRHPRPIVMRAGRFGILAHIDIGFHDIAKIVHVVAEHRRDVSRILRQHCVVAGRSAESRFAGRDRRFADEMFAFIKIGVLLRDADDDFRRTRNAVAVPISHWRRRRRRRDRRGRGWVFGATREKGYRGNGTKSSNEGPASHLDAQSNASRSRFNPKDLGTAAHGFPPGIWEKTDGGGAVVLAQNDAS
jgi:hypothetical protein